MSLRFFPLGYLISSVMVMKSSVGMTGGTPVNDPLYESQRPYLKAINIPKAWKRLTSTKMKRHNVTVALIDTGVKADHPDLVGNLLSGYNVVRNNTNADDRFGHGTLVAGVLGAMVNNSIGMAGAMDLVKILPISFENKLTDAPAAASIDYAIRHKKSREIKIILMTISGDTLRPKMAEKITEAVEAGLLVIVTAGNNGKNVTIEKRYPCALTEQLKGMLCVAGTERSKMRLGSFSNFANYVDIAAPGDTILTTGTSKPYLVHSGTSAAAAIIAGVAAMLYSILPGLISTDVRKILKKTSRKGLKDSKGRTTLPFGLVDADRAVATLIP